MPNKLKILTAVVLCTISFTALAYNKANWTETFNLGNGIWIKHTPNYMILNGLTITKGLDMDTGSVFNGFKISGCGLHVKTNSSRTEFVHALSCLKLQRA